jgi:hypothetical protein
LDSVWLLGVNREVEAGSIATLNQPREKPQEVIQGERHRVHLAEGVREAAHDKLVAIRGSCGTDGGPSKEPESITIAAKKLGTVVGVGQDLGSACFTHSSTIGAADEEGLWAIGEVGEGEALDGPSLPTRERES